MVRLVMDGSLYNLDAQADLAHSHSIYITVWDKAWVNSLTPWDAAAPQPALLELVQDPKTSGLLPKSGRALVPGCGRGYDVELLARRGLNAVGADISPTAVSKAKEVCPRPQDLVRNRNEHPCTDHDAFFSLSISRRHVRSGSQLKPLCPQVQAASALPRPTSSSSAKGTRADQQVKNQSDPDSPSSTITR